jgi:hypothetical protein
MRHSTMNTRIKQQRGKLVMDRVLPVAAFEKDVVKSGGKNSISINITGVGATTISSNSEEEEDFIEGDDFPFVITSGYRSPQHSVEKDKLTKGRHTQRYCS